MKVKLGKTDKVSHTHFSFIDLVIVGREGNAHFSLKKCLPPLSLGHCGDAKTTSHALLGKVPRDILRTH